MYQAVKGIYENGVLTLLEPAPIQEKSEVIVTFISTEKVKVLKPRVPGGLLRLRNLKHGEITIPSDFNMALDDLKDYMG
jgi:predicted DNA-binding antitoxin AbrB/MazE fold protein